jgi:hypothetical protein
VAIVFIAEAAGTMLVSITLPTKTVGFFFHRMFVWAAFACAVHCRHPPIARGLDPGFASKAAPHVRSGH